MEKIPLPTTLTITPTQTPHTSIITLEPCYPGYGTTIGNSIRRHLLSSLPGAAVIGFKIEGAHHEFSTIEHVKEDVIEISLNLKKLRFKMYSDTPVKLTLQASGQKEITAKNFESSHDVEIVNTDLHLATLTNKKAHLDMEIMVSQGRGYLPTEAREKEDLETGFISIDANFSPIEKIGFHVENVRVGQMTNWDKLILEITTDGTLDPKEALNSAVKDLLEHCIFIESQTRAETQAQPEIVVEKETEIEMSETQKKKKTKKGDEDEK